MKITPETAVEGTVISVTMDRVLEVRQAKVWALPPISQQLADFETAYVENGVWYAFNDEARTLRILRQPSYGEFRPFITPVFTTVVSEAETVLQPDVAPAEPLASAVTDVPAEAVSEPAVKKWWQVIDYFFGEVRMLINGQPAYKAVATDAEGKALVSQYQGVQYGDCPLLT